MARPGRDADAGAAIREFGLALRRRRDDRALTQERVADHLDVTRATLSQWETGRHLPSAENAAGLDELLGAAGELVALADAARGATGETPQEVTRLSLREVHDRVAAAIVGRLVRDPETRAPIGWSHDFDPDLPPTPLSSAFAIKTLRMLDTPYVDLAALAAALLRRREAGGGWGPRRMRVRPESSAIVLDALARIGADVDVDAELVVIERLIDEAALSSTKPRATSSTYVLSTVLEVVARLRPGSTFANRLTTMLLDLQRGSGWPEKKVAGPASVRPLLSTAHTSRAVVALAVVRDTPPADDLAGRAVEVAEHARARTSARDAVTRGIGWLQQNAIDYPVRENLYAIDKSDQIGDLEIRHMTSALIARALALADEPEQVRIQRALDTLWSRYDPDLGLWVWPNGDLPLWLQYDAVAATRVAAGQTMITLPSPEEP